MAWVALVAVVGGALALDLRLFARDRLPRVGESLAWSVGWLALGLAGGLALLALSSASNASVYLTVYLIERSLSLDNLFVVLVLFASFGVAAEQRARLLTSA